MINLKTPKTLTTPPIFLKMKMKPHHNRQPLQKKQTRKERMIHQKGPLEDLTARKALLNAIREYIFSAAFFFPYYYILTMTFSSFLIPFLPAYHQLRLMQPLCTFHDPH